MPVLGRTAAREPVSDTPALLIQRGCAAIAETTYGPQPSLCRCYPASAPDLQRAVLGTTTLRRPKGYSTQIGGSRGLRSYCLVRLKQTKPKMI